METLKADCDTCKYQTQRMYDPPCIDALAKIADCDTCKYQTQRMYDPPCVDCRDREDFGPTKWEPIEIETTRENIIDKGE